MELRAEGEGGAVVQEVRVGKEVALGRSSGHSAQDRSVSRVQALARLEPRLSCGAASADKAEGGALADSPIFKLHIRVVGRNPICILRARGRPQIVGDGGLQDAHKVEFLSKSEEAWLDEGDRFSLSIRNPFFLVLSSKTEPADYSARPSPVDNLAHLKSSISKELVKSAGCRDEKNEQSGKEMAEEAGIAAAVARRMRIKAERERTDALQQQESADERHGNEARTTVSVSQDRSKALTVDVKSDHEARDTSSKMEQSNDLANDFGIVIEGREFEQYKALEVDPTAEWDWRIRKRHSGEVEDDIDENNEVRGGTKKKGWMKFGVGNVDRHLGKSQKSRRICRGKLEDDEEWNPEVDEDRSEGAKRQKEQQGMVRPGMTNGNEVYDEDEDEDEDDEELQGFIVDESEETDAEESGENVDENDTLGETQRKRRTRRERPVCRYGSKCYRRDVNHLAEYKHPPQ